MVLYGIKFGKKAFHYSTFENKSFAIDLQKEVDGKVIRLNKKHLKNFP